MAKLVSKTYGDALFDVAMENGRLDDMLAEAETLEVVLNENEDLVRLMNHPKVPKEEKITLLENCFKDRLSSEMVGTLRLMVMKDRFNEIDEVLSYFVTRVKDHKGIGLATVTSPTELTNDQKEKIKAKLLETTAYKEMEVTYALDPSLIGGLVIRIKDHVVDSSVRTKLEKLSRQLSDIQLKAGESAS